ncbi:hypothetical protein Tsubulata_010902, partial [Turnera subulata]
MLQTSATSRRDPHLVLVTTPEASFTGVLSFEVFQEAEMLGFFGFLSRCFQPRPASSESSKPSLPSLTHPHLPSKQSPKAAQTPLPAKPSPKAAPSPSNPLPSKPSSSSLQPTTNPLLIYVIPQDIKEL